MKTKNIKLLVFHDERYIRKNWFYHGYILCKQDDFQNLCIDLLEKKLDACCSNNKRIHFSDLSSVSKISSRTKTAVKWAKLTRDKLYYYMWFYLFGIDMSNIDYSLFGPTTSGHKKERDFTIYNSFFEIGLFSSCRYFFDIFNDTVEIINIFTEERSLEADNPFLNYAPNRINRRQSNVIVKCNQITQVASSLSREKEHPECVNMVNFVDVITGSFSQIMDCTGKQDGCIEVAQTIFPIYQRLYSNPYNEESRYYKRYAMSFFPKTPQTKKQLISYGITPPGNLFYPSRIPLLNKRKCLPGFEKYFPALEH